MIAAAMLVMAFFLCALTGNRSAQRSRVMLPFSRSTLSRDEFEPVTIALTEKEVKRCIEAMDWYIESFAPEMESRGLDLEIARYEDLMYRFMGVPAENMKMHVEQRKQDGLS